MHFSQNNLSGQFWFSLSWTLSFIYMLTNETIPEYLPAVYSVDCGRVEVVMQAKEPMRVRS